MTATVIEDLALLIGAVGFLLISAAGWLLVYRRGVQKITASLGQASVSIDAKLDHQAERVEHAVTQLEQVNKAVNNVGPKEPSIPDRLVLVEAKLDWIVQHSPEIPAFPPVAVVARPHTVAVDHPDA